MLVDRSRCVRPVLPKDASLQLQLSLKAKWLASIKRMTKQN